MLNLKGIDHINMRVTNLNESVRFYQQLFNFKEVEAGFSSSNERYKIIGTSRVAFLALYESNEPIKADHVGHIGFNITNFDEVLNTLKKLKLEVAQYGDVNGIVNYAHSQSIYILDPDKNEIEISSHFGGAN